MIFPFWSGKEVKFTLQGQVQLGQKFYELSSHLLFWMSRKRSDDCTNSTTLSGFQSRYNKRGIRFFGVILERLSLLKSWTLPTNIKNMKLFFIFSFSLMLVVTKSKPIEKPRAILKSGNYAIIDSFKIVSNISNFGIKKKIFQKSYIPI